MQNAAAMRMLDRAGHCHHESSDGPLIAAEFVDSLAEAAAGDELHREERPSAVFANFIDRHDVGMTQPRDGAGFHQKSLAIGARFAAVEQHLQRDNAAEALLPRFEHDSHPAARDLSEQLVITKGAARLRHGGNRRFAAAESRNLGRPKSLAAQQLAQRRELAFDLIVVLQKARDLRLILGMLIDERLEIRLPAGSAHLDASGDERIDGFFGIVVVHTYAPVSNCSRSPRKPRLRSPATAVGERSINWPISAMLKPCKWCKVTASC